MLMLVFGLLFTDWSSRSAMTSSLVVCLSFWCFFFPAWSFSSVRPPPRAAAAAAAATLRSARLIINRHWEKVTAGSPGVTVAMGTLINILFPLVCPLARSCWSGLLSLWHMWTEADGGCDVTATSPRSSRRFAGGCCSRSWLCYSDATGLHYMHPDSVTPSSVMWEYWLWSRVIS